MTSVMRLLADCISLGPHEVKVVHVVDGQTWHSSVRFQDIEAARSVADEVKTMDGVQSVEVIEVEGE